MKYILNINVHTYPYIYIYMKIHQSPPNHSRPKAHRYLVLRATYPWVCKAPHQICLRENLKIYRKQQTTHLSPNKFPGDVSFNQSGTIF